MGEESNTSRISGFYRLSTDERLRLVQRFANLSDEEVSVLRGVDRQRLAQADKMIENVAGLFHLPIGLAANFRLDGVDRLIPMVTEEPSVVAAASHGAKLLRGGDGILTSATPPLMIGQIQLCDVPDLVSARSALEEAADSLVQQANDGATRLVSRGGGARELTVRTFEQTAIGPMLVIHLLVDVCDAMGANLVNGMVESLAPECERLSGGQACLRILSNLADRRLVRAEGRLPVSSLSRPDLSLSGEEVAERLVRASVFAEEDPYRAATHNKGIMNGVDAFLVATGQDWRAVEAGAHAYAARDGRYTAFATWRVEDDELVGRLTLPMQVGVVGGVVKVHPVVPILLKVLGVSGASGVGRVAGAVGLAQNLAAILALSTEGIQRGHMSLHARNIAAAAGAADHEIEHIVAEMIRRRTISHDGAVTIIDESKRASADETLSIGDVQELIVRSWPAMEEMIVKSLPRGSEPGTLGDMVWYQLDTGGKRLRAILPLVVQRAMGGDPDQVLAFGAALEVLHNATLIHNDAESGVRNRRGRDTLWVRYGLDQAINCGDGMMCLAVECLGQLPHDAAVVRQLEHRLTRQMIRVIQAQIEARRNERSVDAWLALTRERTGGLFGTALAGSAILASGPEETITCLETLGGHLGVIFQIQDELLDFTGGKPGLDRGRAIAEGRMGLLLAHCLSSAPEESAASLATILKRPQRDTRDEDIATARPRLDTHGSLQYGVSLLQESQEAVERLCEDLHPPGLAILLTGIGDIFLAPLLAALPPDPADQ
ncbi:MAG: hydroxymethylglutaryl-CoA reductase, degradative [Myxococcota bacterium]|nr:hydroxymethylglutaryl-CoA reductase, degradative [Myxococcota bacterium]